MKRTIVLAALLLAASACATTTEAPSNSNAQPANANASTTPKASTTVTDADITAKEKAIWEEIKEKDSNGFAAMLADDFILVASDGIHDRAGTIDAVKEMALTEMTFSDWKVLMLNKDAALVTYTANTKGTSGGEPMPATPSRSSSVWVNRGGDWKVVFHQETDVKERPPEGTPPSKPATPAATKAATPVTPDADPVAREKQVWEAIQKRDYDTFASFLTEDQIEVFEWGVNDKAQSIEGVKNVDLSKGTIGDFKTVKLNDGATLVTYTVKGPTPPFSKDGERASSIWVNRNGKWLAAFHQGTSIKKAPVSPSK